MDNKEKEEIEIIHTPLGTTTKKKLSSKEIDEAIEEEFKKLPEAGY